MTAHARLKTLITTAVAKGPMRSAVVYPCSEPALRAALDARAQGIAVPTLVGPSRQIKNLADTHGLELQGVDIVDAGVTPIEASAAAVELCRAGNVDMIMKGSLHTDELLSVLLRKDASLRTERRVSHAFVFDAPAYPKLLAMTDCVVNIQPTLQDKVDILRNVIGLMQALGRQRPAAAVLSAVETVNPAIPGTMEAAVLAKMAARGQITDADVDGPLAFDVAISEAAATQKGVMRGYVGEPDILLVPNLEAGNMLYKQLVYLGGAECAGVVLGLRLPVVLTSRADSVVTRIASCALAALQAHAACGTRASVAATAPLPV
jgi:phosphate acetyltransferase